MLDFSNTPLFEIHQTLKQIQQPFIEFKVLNPDTQSHSYSGKELILENKPYIYRSYKSYMELAQALHYKFLTPQLLNNNEVVIRLEKLQQKSFHNELQSNEKYGVNSLFGEIHKNEESSFLHYYTQALKQIKICEKTRVLNLGVNSADEFEIIQMLCKNFPNIEIVGIDYCPSAIAKAKEKFQSFNNVTFYQHDITQLQELNLGEFDALITIGTLQSSNLNFNATLMDIVQTHLTKNSSLVLGFPNCRWIDGEMVYGAKVKNYNFSEMGLLFKDVVFAKKYLQQKKFRVTISGKDYIFLSAIKII